MNRYAAPLYLLNFAGSIRVARIHRYFFMESVASNDRFQIVSLRSCSQAYRWLGAFALSVETAEESNFGWPYR